MKTSNQQQPWLISASFDTGFIIAPSVVILLLVAVFYALGLTFDEVPVWAWWVLVVGIDVGHVYSTLFRTYTNPTEFWARPVLYVLTPIIVFVGALLLYQAGELWFWRVVAYIAVYHFLRQQYGFMMLYRRQEVSAKAAKLLDQAVLYLSMIYPLVYWHTHTRSFSWFVPHDFVSGVPVVLSDIVLSLYGVLAVIYVLKEAITWQQSRFFNVPKNALLLSTAAIWWVGIVLIDNDLVFTATNVLAHGVPYIALIWIYQRRYYLKMQAELGQSPKGWSQLFGRVKKWPVYVLILFAFAVAEESIWDVTVWHENLPAWMQVELSEPMLMWLVPLLIVPQVTHYLLDRVIWRFKTGDPNWAATLFFRTNK